MLTTRVQHARLQSTRTVSVHSVTRLSIPVGVSHSVQTCLLLAQKCHVSKTKRRFDATESFAGDDILKVGCQKYSRAVFGFPCEMFQKSNEQSAAI